MILSQEGEKAYRIAYDLVRRREVKGSNEIWQADHTQLDLVARRDDGRGRCPWLTLITDEYNRAITGFAFFFDAPSTIRTALPLRQAIWRKAEPHLGICGIPEVLYFDNGSDSVFEHLQQVAADLKIRLVHSMPGVPRGRGKVERLFRTVRASFSKSKALSTPPSECMEAAPSAPDFVSAWCRATSVYRAGNLCHAPLTLTAFN